MAVPRDDDALETLLGLRPSRWMMSQSERLAILGILLAFKPRSVLEFGCADAGLTAWLSRYSEQVVTVDMDPKVVEVTRGLTNVVPWCMSTEQAAALIAQERRHFEVAIVDADHSEQGVRRDLENALRFSDMILLHDTYYPPCRRGILSALSDKHVYFDLELVPGGLQSDGLWGGLGVVLAGRGYQHTYGTARRSCYPVLKAVWRLQQQRRLVTGAYHGARQMAGAALRRLGIRR